MSLNPKLKPLAVSLGVVAALCVWAHSLLCACVALMDLARDHVREEIQRVAAAQQEYLATHQRYARTLVELRYTSDTTMRVRIGACSDSSVRIGVTWVRMPEFSCSVLLTSEVRSVDHLVCTYQGASA